MLSEPPAHRGTKLAAVQREKLSHTQKLCGVQDTITQKTVITRGKHSLFAHAKEGIHKIKWEIDECMQYSNH